MEVNLSSRKGKKTYQAVGKNHLFSIKKSETLESKLLIERN